MLVTIGGFFMVFDSFIVLSFQMILFVGAKIGNIILLINRIGTCYHQRFHECPSVDHGIDTCYSRKPAGILIFNRHHTFFTGFHHAGTGKLNIRISTYHHKHQLHIMIGIIYIFQFHRFRTTFAYRAECHYFKVHPKSATILIRIVLRYRMLAGNDSTLYPDAVVVRIVIAQNNDFLTEESRSVSRIVSHFHFPCGIGAKRFFRIFKLYTTTTTRYPIDRKNFLTDIPKLKFM